jgi:hypothetical protein
MRLVSACLDGRLETVRKLLAAGVDPDGPEQLRGQPLSFAILNGHVEVVHALLDAGADPEALSVDGSTPLYTARQCNPEIYRLLRARGARRTGAAVRARAEAERVRSDEQMLADFWATPVERLRGEPPWMSQHKSFENLLVKAPVPKIKQAMLAYEHARPLPADTAHDSAPVNTPVRAAQFRPTGRAGPQPEGQRLTFARLRGHDWTQVRGGHNLGGRRAFSNESLARYLSRALRTKAFHYGYEHVSGECYHQLHDRGRRVAKLPGRDEVFRAEGIFDPDVYWVPDEHSVTADGGPILIPSMPWSHEEDPRGFRREDFVEVDSVVVQAVDDGGEPRE